MNLNSSDAGRLPATFMTTGSSSFTEFIGAHSPELLPSRRPLPVGGTIEAPHGTTIVSLTYDGGVVMAMGVDVLVMTVMGDHVTLVTWRS